MFVATVMPRVSSKGARAGSILCGLKPRNDGLRVRILADQDRGDGPIRGRFILLDAGCNPYSDVLLPLVGNEADAATILETIRRKYRLAVNVVNANLLGVEKPAEPSTEKQPVICDTPAFSYFTPNA